MIEEEILELIRKKGKTNYTQIAEELGIHIMTVSDIVERLAKQKKVKIEEIATAKLISLR